MGPDHFYLIKMRVNNIVGYVGIILIFSFMIFAAKNFFSNEEDINGNMIIEEVKADHGNFQIVELGFKNYNYYPNTINLKYNVPTKIIVDTNNVKGCMRSIVIPDFNVRKLVKENDNVITFVPNQKGIFKFSCSMGMGFGSIVVE